MPIFSSYGVRILAPSLFSLMALSLSACQSSPSNSSMPHSSVTGASVPSVALQKNPNPAASPHPTKPFTEIPLITESNRPADQPDAHIPPFGQENSQSNSPSKITASWRKPAIAKSATDAIYVQEWGKSKSKAACPILALPTTAGAHLQGHSGRRANFSGGWGVAYDLPKQRSAYGVANVGVSEPVGPSSMWQDYTLYDDGTELTYGREGGNPNGKWLAYLTLGKQYSPAAQPCLYNIWSQQSKGHLEQLLSELRIVTTSK